MKNKKQENAGKAPAEKQGAAAGKMTIYEYEEKYVRRQNTRSARLLLKLIVTALGVFLFACLFFVALRVWELNMYAGIAAAVICAALYIFLFIVPVVKIFRSDYFVVNVNARTAREAQRHNKELRRKISDKIIDFTASVDGVGWYDDALVGRLAIAVETRDDEMIKATLSALYADSVKKSAKSIIFGCAAKSAMYSAVSQSNNIDAALVAVINLQMVKDIVFLYGFRPSDAKLMKIFCNVLTNSLIAYGLGGLKIGNGVVKTMGDAVKGIPVLGTAISVLVDSSVQGLTNGTLTAVIGYQTIKYLNQEYKLQDILDNVEIEENEEQLKKDYSELEAELKSQKKKDLAKAG